MRPLHIYTLTPTYLLRNIYQSRNHKFTILHLQVHIMLPYIFSFISTCAFGKLHVYNYFTAHQFIHLDISICTSTFSSTHHARIYLHLHKYIFTSLFLSTASISNFYTFIHIHSEITKKLTLVCMFTNFTFNNIFC